MWLGSASLQGLHLPPVSSPEEQPDLSPTATPPPCRSETDPQKGQKGGPSVLSVSHPRKPTTAGLFLLLLKQNEAMPLSPRHAGRTENMNREPQEWSGVTKSWSAEAGHIAS